MFNAIVKDTAAALEGPACASIVALRQTSDNIQVAIEVEDIRTYNLRNSKKHKTATQAGPSALKNLVKRKRMEGSSDVAWVGV